MTIVAPMPSGPVPHGSTTPTFSVVISVYQGARCIGDAIRSVLDQRTPAPEILVCDGGSTDDLDASVAPFAGRVTVLRQQHNGVASARDLGLHHATGEFGAVCDAENMFLPGLIEAWSNLAVERPDIDILGMASYLEQDGEAVGVSRTPQSPPYDIEDQRPSILQADFIGGCSAFRRKCLVDLGG